MSTFATKFRFVFFAFFILLPSFLFPFVFTAHVDGGNVFAVFFGIFTGISVILNPRNIVSGLGYFVLAAGIVMLKTVYEGCFSVDGLILFLLIPLSAISLCAALALLLPSNSTKIRIGLFLFSWIVLAALSFLIPFYSSPSVSYLSPVWGWWPGPIYDGAVTVHPRVLTYFGGMFSLGAAFQLWHFSDRKGLSVQNARLIFGFALISGFWSVFSTQQSFDKNFSNVLISGQVTVFSTSGIPAEDAGFYARYADEQVQEIKSSLAISDSLPSEKIHLYLYANAWEKQLHTGAFETSYVPVWLKTPQVHITRQDFQASIKHELVHAVLKPYGNSLFGASWNPALIEGAAVALAPNPYAQFSPDQLVKNGNEAPERIQEMFTLSGFYLGRGGLSYTFAGSFLGFLIRTYPPESFLKSYASGDLEKFYGVSMDSMISGWKKHLAEIPSDSLIQKPAQRLFSQPSLLEESCARTLLAEEALLDRVGWLEAKALMKLADSVLVQNPDTKQRLVLWMKHSELALKTGRPLLSFSDSLEIRVRLRQADWAFLHGEEQGADAFLAISKRLIQQDPDSEAWMNSTFWRFEKARWKAVLNARYRPDSLTTTEFELLPADEFFRLLYEATPQEAQKLAARISPEIFRKKEFSSLLLREWAIFQRKAGLISSN